MPSDAPDPRRHEHPPPAAWRPLAFVSLLVALTLLLASSRYGYHRDELYFLVLGRHPAAGYVDQPPLVPLLDGVVASATSSLVALRTPTAAAAATVALLGGLLARELGGGRRTQVLAAACTGWAAVLLAGAHLATTTPFDLLWWSATSWALVRALVRRGRAWLLVGLFVGLGLETKLLIVLLVAGVLVGLATVGPRNTYRDPWLWGAAALALLLWLPNLWWQVANGLPQVEMATSIAAGGSGTSDPRWLVPVMQLVLVSPLLCPIWVAGLVRLARHDDLRPWRSFSVAYAVVLVLVIAAGGKAYYVAGLYPVLLAAGAPVVVHWVDRGSQRTRWVVVGGVVGLSAAINAVLTLPVVPADRLQGSIVQAVNYDAGEQVGWPAFAATIDTAYREAAVNDPGAVVVAGNYGEAGAVSRFGAGEPVYSGHNSLYPLGPPPPGTETVVAVGYPEEDLRSWFADCEQTSAIRNPVGVENDEWGRHVWVCHGPRRSWATLWPEMRVLG